VIAMMESRISEKKRQLNWGPSPETLPRVKKESLQNLYKGQHGGVVSHSEWIILNGYIIDVSSFTEQHPGGKEILQKYYGRDASKAFDGSIATHTLAARMKAETLRVAVLVE
jgi:stearoyl-CoA desaturase (Delta-9 desaturase)